LWNDATFKEEITMKKFLCSVLLCGVAAIPAIAQGGAAPAAAPQAPAAVTADPLATFVKNSFNQISRNLNGSAEQMPEANYGMKIGTMPEVRTFGSMLGHIIDANYLFCSQAKGEASPATMRYETTKDLTKDQLVKAMHDAITYCSSVYDTLTDVTAMQMVTPPAGPAGPARAQLRVAILIRNVGHNNEEYGNLVGYFRAANLVPPSTAAAAAGAGGRRGN
jgi:hypothetical protein